MRCKYCDRERKVSARAHAENPFCALCLQERIALSTLRDGHRTVFRESESGDYMESYSVRLTKEERADLLSFVKAEQAKRGATAAASTASAAARPDASDARTPSADDE